MPGVFLSVDIGICFRLSIGSALLELVKPWDESLEMVAAFLPGICCCMGDLACTDMNVAIVNMALKVISTCFNVLNNQVNFFVTFYVLFAQVDLFCASAAAAHSTNKAVMGKNHSDMIMTIDKSYFYSLFNSSNIHCLSPARTVLSQTVD